MAEIPKLCRNRLSWSLRKFTYYYAVKSFLCAKQFFWLRLFLFKELSKIFKDFSRVSHKFPISRAFQGLFKACANYAKFMVWILNLSFKFLTPVLDFYSWIQSLHSSFRLRITGKFFIAHLLAFKLNSSIWPCSMCIFNSLPQIT